MLQTALSPVRTGAHIFPPFKNVASPQMRVTACNSQVTLLLHVPMNEHDGEEVIISNAASARLGVRSKNMFLVIQDMVIWIENHLATPLSVQEISRKSGYSVWHLQRLFTQLTGFSVYEFIRVRRAINVTYALIRGGKPLIDIALDNGFNCQVSFTRAIREITGYTPGYIRRNFLLNNNWLINTLQSLVSKH